MDNYGSVPSRGGGSRIVMNSPISSTRLDRLVADVAAQEPATVVDIGCGWGEALIRVLEQVPDCRGTGIDLHEPDIDRARATTRDRCVENRSTFIAGDAGSFDDSVDLAINIGSYQAFSDVETALRRFHAIVKPGGRLLFGIEIWMSIPTDVQLSNMWKDASVDDCMLLADIVDVIAATGWRVLDLQESSRDEWDAFECGLMRDREEWLVANPGAPGVEEMSWELDKHRRSWLRGHRDVMGFATFVLGPIGTVNLEDGE